MNAMLVLAAMMTLPTVATPQSPKDFLISYWCGVKTGSDYDARYAEVKDCGFTYAFPPTDFWGTTLESNRGMLDACAKQGLKCVILDMRLFHAKPEDSGFDAVLDAVVKDYSSHPAMAGYWLADEPHSDAFPRLDAISKALRTKDPMHFSFVNLFPGVVDQQPSWKGSYEDYVKGFCDQLDPDILSFDNYVLLANGDESPRHFENLEIIRKNALKKRIPACFILQAIGCKPWRDPSTDEYRWQVNSALVYGFKAIMYFYYWSPAGDKGALNDVGILDSNGNQTHRYNRVKRVNAEVKNLAPTLLKLTSTGVYHTGSLPIGCIPPDGKVPVQQTSGGPLVIGTFKHEDGSRWMMIVNRYTDKTTKAELKFAKNVKTLTQISSKTGATIIIALANQKASFDLGAGEAVLVKLGEGIP